MFRLWLALFTFGASAAIAGQCASSASSIKKTYFDALGQTGPASLIDATAGIKAGIGMSNNTMSAGPMDGGSQSVAASFLSKARVKSKEIIDAETEGNGKFKTANNARELEAFFLYRSIDSASKLVTVKSLHSDLLSNIADQNLLIAKGRLLILQELFSDLNEKEFKSKEKYDD